MQTLQSIGVLDTKSLQHLKQWYEIVQSTVPKHLTTFDQRLYARICELLHMPSFEEV